MTTAEPAEVLDALGDPAAEERLVACCASRRGGDAMLAARPFGSRAALLAHSDTVLHALSWADVEEALAAHPRIGERVAGAGREAGWSRSEQSGAATASSDVHQQLHWGNQHYEEGFGYVFLICATGLSADSMLTALRERLDHEAGTERRGVRDELRKNVRVRLEKLA